MDQRVVIAQLNIEYYRRKLATLHNVRALGDFDGFEPHERNIPRLTAKCGRKGSFRTLVS